MIGAGPGERHDLARLMLALLLARTGWRITFLGAETPAEALEEVIGACAPTEEVIRAVRPRLALLSATLPERAVETLPALRQVGERLGRQAPLLAHGGPAFRNLAVPAADAQPCIGLSDDVPAAARHLAALAP